MPNYITKSGLKDLEEELKKILDVDLPIILDAVNVAREDGDLRENAAYQTALKVKDELTTRQQELEEILKDYEIINEDTQGLTKIKVVQIGSSAKIEYQDSKSSFDIKIVGSSESNILKGKISNESPLAIALLGKKVNDTVSFKAPSGKLSVKILEINN
jgi:transcription elongation factor GreA